MCGRHARAPWPKLPAPAPSPSNPHQAVAGAASTLDAQYLCADKVANATIVEQLPQLKIEQTLETKKQRLPTDVTLVTQLSFER